jgi:hypothetical protein
MRTLAFLVAGLVTVACGMPSDPIPSRAFSQPTVVSTTAATLTPQIDACALMPLADVQADSPFGTPLADADDRGITQQCEYTSASGAEEPVSVLIVITDFGTTDNAQVHQDNYRLQAADTGFSVQELSGLGDDAFAFGVDEVGVHASRGALVVDVNMSGEYPDTTDASKVSAGTSLVGKVFARLP